LKLSCFLTTGIDGKKSWETIHRLLGIEHFGGEMLQKFRDIEIFVSSEICFLSADISDSVAVALHSW